MAKKSTNEENKERLSSKIASDTEAFFARGGKVFQATSQHNAGTPSPIKKSRKQALAAEKKRVSAGAQAVQIRKKNTEC